MGHGGQADERLKIALASMHANMRAFYRLLGERSQGGTVVERDGILAAVVPSCPNRSIVNAVVYEDAGALAAIRDDLEAFYDQAGVRAWTVWVPEADRATAQLLERAGHRLDARPRAMTLEISEVDFGGAGGIDWERTNDLAVVAAINESAYGLQAGVQKFGYALFFMTDSALKWIDKSDGWELGVGPSIVVVDIGAATSMTTTTLQSEIYAFFFDQKGLMGGLGIQGTKITRIEK